MVTQKYSWLHGYRPVFWLSLHCERTLICCIWSCFFSVDNHMWTHHSLNIAPAGTRKLITSCKRTLKELLCIHLSPRYVSPLLWPSLPRGAGKFPCWLFPNVPCGSKSGTALLVQRPNQHILLSKRNINLLHLVLFLFCRPSYVDTPFSQHLSLVSSQRSSNWNKKTNHIQQKNFKTMDQLSNQSNNQSSNQSSNESRNLCINESVNQ